MGLSQLAAVMGTAIDWIDRNQALRVIVRAEVLASVRQEALELQAAFGKLGSSSLRLTDHEHHELEEAAREVHAWLKKDTSLLRQFICAMSSGGLFFVAQCHEKAARGFVLHGGGSLQAVKGAATASSKLKVKMCDDAAGFGGA